MANHPFLHLMYFRRNHFKVLFAAILDLIVCYVADVCKNCPQTKHNSRFQVISQDTFTSLVLTEPRRQKDAASSELAD